MVSKADIQQVILSAVFFGSLIILTIAEPQKKYEVFIEYLPSLEYYTGIQTRIVLAILVFVSIFAIIIIQEFKKQDRSL